VDGDAAALFTDHAASRSQLPAKTKRFRPSSLA
jgi:hypothetical protein